jgi:hypothetical protein
MDELRQKLEKHHQSHLLDFWDENTEDENKILKADIDNVDLEYTTQSFERCTQAAEDKANAGKLDDRMMPVPSKNTYTIYIPLSGNFLKTWPSMDQGSHSTILEGKTATVAATLPACCCYHRRFLFCKIQVRLRSCRSYLFWRPYGLDV